MKTIAYAAAGLLTSALFVASPASAQMAETPAPAQNHYEIGMHDGMSGDMDEDAMMEHMKKMHEGMEGKSASGPVVRLVRGDAKLFLKCAADDSTEDCVNSAMVLLDHVTGQKKETAQAKTEQGKPAAPASPGGQQPQQTH